MNITQENIDKLNAVLNVKVEQSDYEERVDEVLKDYRRKARVDGFRPGKVPMGLIRKMYLYPGTGGRGEQAGFRITIQLFLRKTM